MVAALVQLAGPDLRDGQVLVGGAGQQVARYHAAWKPEADAISWIGGQIRYQHPGMFLRVILARAFGIDVTSQAKSSTRSYAEVRHSARRLGPLWA